MPRVRFAALLLPFTLAACSARPRETARIPAAWRFANVTPPTVGESAMVVSEHPLASQVGAEVLRRGGNAIDAAVAVGFAQAVVNPRAGNIGGGGYLLYRTARGEVFALDYRESAPAAASRDMYLDAGGNVTGGSLEGARASGVPGSVAGMFEMHRRFGRLPWRDVLEPAIRLAREGHVVDTARHRRIVGSAERLARHPTSARIFLPEGSPLPAGTTWLQPDLARTLDRIADSGAAGFYRGRTADLILEQERQSDGIISRADLEAYRPLWREPIRIAYRGWTVLSLPPSSSGGVTLALLFNMLEGYRRLPDFGTAELIHLEVEAMRRAFTERNRWLGDPAFVEMPLARLLSKSYAAELRAQIRPARATPSSELPPVAEESETTHYSIVDAEGNAAAVTTTINDNFGNAIVVGGAGFLLNNEMDDFTAKPGAPNDYGLVQGRANAIEPGKRMLSAMSPTIVLDPQGRLALVLGSPGGPRIMSAVFQVISNVVDHRMSLAEAVFAPRIHHQALPDSIRWEPNGVSPETRTELERMGHVFRSEPQFETLVQAIRATPRGLEGVFDPRTVGGAAGW